MSSITDRKPYIATWRAVRAAAAIYRTTNLLSSASLISDLRASALTSYSCRRTTCAASSSGLAPGSPRQSLQKMAQSVISTSTYSFSHHVTLVAEIAVHLFIRDLHIVWLVNTLSAIPANIWHHEPATSSIKENPTPCDTSSILKLRTYRSSWRRQQRPPLWQSP